METVSDFTGRNSYEEIIEQNRSITSLEYITQITESKKAQYLILNANRQIVFANKKFLAMFETISKSVLGQRPGELLDCVNSKIVETGCGSHDSCCDCGIANSILSAVDGKVAENECRIGSIKEGRHVSFDLSVKAQPFYFDGEEYILFHLLT